MLTPLALTFPDAHTHTQRDPFSRNPRMEPHSQWSSKRHIYFVSLSTYRYLIMSSIVSLIWEPEFWRNISSDSETQIQKSHVKVLSNRREEITMTMTCTISGQIIKENLWVGWIHKHSPFPWRTQSHTQAHDLASGVRGLSFRPDLCSLIQVSLDNQYVQPNVCVWGQGGGGCIMKSREMNSILPKIIKHRLDVSLLVFLQNGWLRLFLAFLPALGFYYFQALN